MTDLMALTAELVDVPSVSFAEAELVALLESELRAAKALAAQAMSESDEQRVIQVPMTGGHAPEFATMLAELRKHFAGLSRFFSRMYLGAAEGDAGPRVLFGCRDGRVRVIWSREGTTQGDPGGPLLFALATQPALEAIQAAVEAASDAAGTAGQLLETMGPGDPRRANPPGMPKFYHN